MKEKKVIIIGAGLVGSLCAIHLIKKGYSVQLFERRKDLRTQKVTAGKSINLALSKRGWTSLEQADIHEYVKKIAIPMYRRVMHDSKGNLTFQQYGESDQAIFSVSRVELNLLMLNLAEKYGAEIHFNSKCVDVDFNNTKATFLQVDQEKTYEADFIVGADGTFSNVRSKMVEKLGHMYNYNKIEYDYKELLIPSGPNNSYLIEKEALHIWPRGNFMVIALANLDGSFTCTLFAAKHGKDSFENLNAEKETMHYFNKHFPDFTELVPNLYEQWQANPTSELGIVKTFPWNKKNVLLIGDSAHATVPFYGQGMNAGFEDCRILSDMLDIYKENYEKCFDQFSIDRKPEGDGLQDLSLHNFIVMRDKTADPSFLLQKKIEQKVSKLHPEKWLPLYSMVSFSNIKYSTAWEVGKKQEQIMAKIMKLPQIEKKWDDEFVIDMILKEI